MVTIQGFNENYVSNVKDIMLQICLNEYKCQNWLSASYQQDRRKMILDQRFEYFRFYPSHMLMAFDENKLVGFSSIKKINDVTIELRRLYVLAEYRNCGIGKQLYSGMFREINALSGITSVQAIVEVPFIECINFLTKRGFQITFLDPKKLEYRLEKSDMMH